MEVTKCDRCGEYVDKNAVRFLGSYILSMLTGMGTNNDELLGAWMIDICITSIVIAGVITYLYTKGVIIVQ